MYIGYITETNPEIGIFRIFALSVALTFDLLIPKHNQFILIPRCTVSPRCTSNNSIVKIHHCIQYRSRKLSWTDAHTDRQHKTMHPGGGIKIYLGHNNILLSWTMYAAAYRMRPSLEAAACGQIPSLQPGLQPGHEQKKSQNWSPIKRLTIISLKFLLS